MSKKTFSLVALVYLGGGIMACADSSKNPADTTSQGGTCSQGGGGSGGEAGSLGGHSSQGGHTSQAGGGGEGGTGGSSCVGPCCVVPENVAAVIFQAPTYHEDGLIGFSGFVDCEYVQGSGATCQSTNWSSPVPGSVAPEGEDTAVALFGKKPPLTRIYGLGTLHDCDSCEADPVSGYFVDYSDGHIYREGTYVVCVGPMSVGSMMSDTEQGNVFAGSLQASDKVGETSQGQVMFIVPETASED